MKHTPTVVLELFATSASLIHSSDTNLLVHSSQAHVRSVPLLCGTVRRGTSHVEPDQAQRIKTPTLGIKTAQLETVEHSEEKQLAYRA